jgi:hypothetical protein
MEQKIFLIMIAMREVDKDISFPDFIKSRIDWDIRTFLPSGIDFIGCNTYSDFYADKVMEKIYGYDEDALFSRQRGIMDKKVIELTFSSTNDLQFKTLPWLESFISFIAEEYHFIGVLYPYIIKEDGEYTFRIPYRMITNETDDDTESTSIEDDFTELLNNALFFKHHFYEEKIPEQCYSGIAKLLLLDKMVVD